MAGSLKVMAVVKANNDVRPNVLVVNRTSSMACDRTRDFLQFVRLETPLVGARQPLAQSNLPPIREQETTFSQLAQDISVAYDVCVDDLNQLSQLAKQRTLFDDKSADVNALTFRIKQALTGLSSNVDSLEGLCGTLPTSGSPGSQHAAAHRQAILTSLRTRLLDLTREFKDILELRSNNLKQLESRRGLYGQARPDSAASATSMMRRPNNLTGTRGPDPNVAYDLEGQTQSVVLATNTMYHHSRVEAVEQIQRLVGELSGMFTKVASMVGQQEEMVMRIDATVDDSLQRLREGQTHLLKYFNAISSQRSLILKLLGMIAAFAVFFIVFLA